MRNPLLLRMTFSLKKMLFKNVRCSRMFKIECSHFRSQWILKFVKSLQRQNQNFNILFTFVDGFEHLKTMVVLGRSQKFPNAFPFLVSPLTLRRTLYRHPTLNASHYATNTPVQYGWFSSASVSKLE